MPPAALFIDDLPIEEAGSEYFDGVFFLK